MKRILFSLTIATLLVFTSCGGEDDEMTTTPTILTTSDLEVTIKDNLMVGDTIGTVPGTSNKGSVNFDIASQTPDGVFTVGVTSGVLTVSNADLLDSEANPILNLQVNVSKEDMTKTSMVTVNVEKGIDCPSVDLSVWNGELTFDEDGEIVGGTGTASDCGVLNLSVLDFIAFDCTVEDELILNFIPSATDATMGTVIIERQEYTCDSDYIVEVEATGTYDTNTGVIEMDYILYEPGEDPATYPKIITPGAPPEDDDSDDDTEVDSDGDGVPDATDEDPDNACLPVQNAGYTGYDASNDVWASADCDDDTITNGDELTGGTDPYTANTGDDDDDDDDVDCESVDTAIWNGALDVSEEFDGETFSVEANGEAGCAEIVLIGDILGYDCGENAEITIKFIPESDGATNGTISVATQPYACGDFNITYEATGTYDESTETIILNYLVKEEDADDVTGTHTITPM